MDFFHRFFLSMSSAAYYRRLRYDEHGYGLRYSILLLVTMPVLAAILVITNTAITAPIAGGTLHYYALSLNAYTSQLSGVAIVVLLACAVRFIMLFALAVMARLVALKLKPRMDYAAALRMAAAAYTPVALMDAVNFGVTGMIANPFLLFGCALAMLLAAIAVTR